MVREQPVSTRIIWEIAAQEGVDPVELVPLYDTVDTEALDALFRSDAGNVTVTFDYSGYEVTVSQSEGLKIKKAPRV